MGKMILLSLVVFITTSVFSSSSGEKTPSESDQSSDYYDKCKPFDCGNITFGFPFSLSDTFGSGQFDCGLPRFFISCDPTTSSPALELAGRSFTVRNLYLDSNLITVVDRRLIDDLRSNTCQSLRNLSISPSAVEIPSLQLPQSVLNLTFFACPNLGVSLSSRFVEGIVGNYSCREREGYRIYLWDGGTQRGPPGVRPEMEIPVGCEVVMVPGSGASLSRYGFYNKSGDWDNRSMEPLFDVLADGFPLQWPVLGDCERCKGTGGRCGFDGSSNQIVCFCKGGCRNRPKPIRWKLIVGVTTGSTCVLLAAISLLIINYRKRTSSVFKTPSFKRTERKVNQFIKNHQSTLLTNYSYNDVKKMTNSFKEKLGAGGSGNVFKGTLSDGRLIAVKMLENYRDNSHNFVNEVGTIGTIHHVNVIRLLGFCWDGSKQGLIYEYMPNGSLGDLLSNNKANISLTLIRLLEIALGVAHGIEYLHNGCESRILHLDIKPQNVLLDENHSPKISDFGLAKIYSRDKSAVTMTGARGTIGYIAPEIFMRNLGSPSYKSDVYSFGMLLLEMVGGKKHFEVNTNSSREVYFPEYIYDKLTEGGNNVIEEEEECIEKKMVMVGLWCIQMNPKDRPSMKRVVEMLCGNVESIEMPPKPFSFSPPRVQFEYDIASTESEATALRLTSSSQEIV